jgi:Tol biopolymer transport system component
LVVARFFGALALASLVLPLAGTPPTLGVRLNGELARAQIGSLKDVQVSPDGAWFLYLAFQEVTDIHEVHAGPTDLGSEPVRVSADLGVQERVLRARFTPDSARIVYEVHNYPPNNADGIELFSVPADASEPPVLISPAVDLIRDWDVSPDSTRVVLDTVTADATAIYAVSIDGTGTPTQLTGTPSGSSSVWGSQRFEITPDSSFVVFREDNLFDTHELYRVAITGGPHTRLGPALVWPRIVQRFDVSTDGSRVVYSGTILANDVIDLFSAPADGTGSPVQLNGPFVAGGDLAEFRVDPTGAHVVFSADAVVDERKELFTVPIAGGTAVQLTSHLPGGDLFEFAIAPDGTRVLFRANMDTLDRAEVYSSPIDGTGPLAKINGPVGTVLGPLRFSADSSSVVYRRGVATGSFDPILEIAPIDGSSSAVTLDTQPWRPQTDFAFLPDGSRVAFRALEGGLQFNTVLSTIRTDGTDYVTLSSPTDGIFLGVRQFVVTPDSSSVFYIGDPFVADALHVFRSPVDASSPAVVASGPPPLGAVAGEVFNYRVSPDSQWTVYQADQDEDETVELYSVRSDASGSPAKLNDALAPGGDVFFDFLPTGDSTRVVYRADQDVREVIELYSTVIDGSGTPTKLSSLPVAGGDVLGITLTPDGSTVVYRADQDVDGETELYSVPADGSALPVKVNQPLVTGGGVLDHVFTPGTDQVVYRASREVAGRFELYVTAVDGSGPGTKISGSMTLEGDVAAGYVCSPGGRTVFLADAETNDKQELYSVPTDGSEPPVKLNTAMPAFADILSFHVAEDVGRVVYYGDPLVDQQGDLFSVPIDASEPPVHLNSPLTIVNTDVAEFRVTPDGARVVYRADANVNDVFELFSVPTDGGASVRLHSALLGSQDVGGFEGQLPFAITSDSAHVVFRADLSANDRFELFRARVDGSAPSVRISAPAPTNRDVEGFALAANDCVLYEANFDSALEVGLWLAPSTGVGKKRINPNFAQFADVRTSTYDTPNFVLTPDGTRVHYIADQLANSVFELFTSEFSLRALPPRQAPGPVLDGGSVQAPLSFSAGRAGSEGRSPGRAGSPVAPAAPEPSQAESFWTDAAESPLPNRPTRGGP